MSFDYDDSEDKYGYMCTWEHPNDVSENLKDLGMSEESSYNISGNDYYIKGIWYLDRLLPYTRSCFEVTFANNGHTTDEIRNNITFDFYNEENTLLYQIPLKRFSKDLLSDTNHIVVKTNDRVEYESGNAHGAIHVLINDNCAMNQALEDKLNTKELIHFAINTNGLTLQQARTGIRLIKMVKHY